MNKALLFLLLVFTSCLLYPETLLFRSNSMGMTLEKISRIRQDEFDFILTIEALPGKEVRILFENGEEIKRWEIITLPVGRREDSYAAGLLDTVLTYNSLGELLEEITYKDGSVDTKRVYLYDNNLLVEILETDSEETVISSSLFIRGGAGRMQKVVQSFPSGDEKVSAYKYSSEGIVQEWHGTGDSGDLFRFNRVGDIIAEEVWEGNDMTLLRRFSYGESGEYRLVEEDFKSGTTVRKMFDSEDTIIREFSTVKGNLVEDTVYYYDEGRLREKLRKTPGVKERWVYEYDGEDEVVREEYFKNGTLRKIIEYTGDNTFHEDLYRRGEPFIRIYYEDERKVREEAL